jgi:hypothetical protein
MAVQINARVSETTKDLLEKESRATGIKKEFLVEEALLHHFHALHELPSDVIVHPRLVITNQTAEALADQMQAAQPTSALRDLLKRHGD